MLVSKLYSILIEKKIRKKSSGENWNVNKKRKRIGGLGGLDMLYRRTVSMIIKTLFKHGSRESFRSFYIINSSF